MALLQSSSIYCVKVKVGEHGCDRSWVSRAVVSSDETSCMVLDIFLICLCPPDGMDHTHYIYMATYSKTVHTRAMYAVRLLFI